MNQPRAGKSCKEESSLNHGSWSGRSGGNNSGLTKVALGRAEAEAEHAAYLRSTLRTSFDQLPLRDASTLRTSLGQLPSLDALTLRTPLASCHRWMLRLYTLLRPAAIAGCFRPCCSCNHRDDRTQADNHILHEGHRHFEHLASP